MSKLGPDVRGFFRHIADRLRCFEPLDPEKDRPVVIAGLVFAIGMLLYGLFWEIAR